MTGQMEIVINYIKLRDKFEDVKFITSKEGKRKIIDMHIDAIVNYLENKEGDC